MAKEPMKLVANNKKAYHDYFIEEKYETGICLHGTEVKSLRMGKCSVKEAFIRIENGEVFVYGMHISPYEKGNIFNKEPLRVRKLLLHKQARLRRKDIHWCLYKCILRTEGRKWKLDWQKVKSSTTNGKISPRRISAGNQKEISRCGICKCFRE